MCIYITKSEPIFKVCDTKRTPRATRLCAKHRASAKQKCGERIHTPLAEYGGNPERKNTPCISDLAVGEIYFEKGKGVFLSGFCPPSIRAGGVQMQFGRGKVKLFLREDKDLLCLG